MESNNILHFVTKRIWPPSHRRNHEGSPQTIRGCPRTFGMQPLHSPTKEALHIHLSKKSYFTEPISNPPSTDVPQDAAPCHRTLRDSSAAYYCKHRLLLPSLESHYSIKTDLFQLPKQRGIIDGFALVQ